MKLRRRDPSNLKPGQKPEVSAWRLEKAHRQQRQFKRMAAREAAGKTIAKRLRFFSWYWASRFYQCDPSRRVEFSPASLARQYRLWKKEGRVLSALLPQYRPSGPAVPLATLQRFAAFLSRRQWRTVKGSLAGIRAPSYCSPCWAWHPATHFTRADLLRFSRRLVSRLAETSARR